MAASPQIHQNANTAPTAEEPYEVRWDEKSKLFCVWNNGAECWAPRPGFSSQRVAEAVADSLAAPPPKTAGGPGRRS